jgi:coenzyme F420-reducing hydrogenase alpha subunit
MTHSRDYSFGVDALARVEGEGGFRIVVRDGAVSEVALDIFEPPRFFEALLVGRSYLEAPDITARICGICPVAYQMSSCAAMESAFDVAPSRQVVDLRRLLYCGEWLQSHALHVYLLHAPDFFGYEDAVQLAAHDKPVVERGLALKKTGNKIMETVGGRAVHPVNVRVGGFYKAPSPSEVSALAEPLRRALDASLATVEWVAGFDFPDVLGDYLFVALRDEGRYPIEGGRVVSSDGLDCTPAEFADAVVEEHVARSTALHARLFGQKPYLTGPLARYALNADALTPLAAEAAHRAQLEVPCRNPFRSIVVRAVEMVFACEEALRLVESYDPPEPPAADMPDLDGNGAGATPGAKRAGAEEPGIERVGAGATEAPRGVLLHEYKIGADGLIRNARIVPPTSQNQLTIEADLRRVAEAGLELAPEELTKRAEVAVRNHDPCISCAAHFLDLTLERAP